MELITRMMDGSIPYDPEGRLEPVSFGPGANQGDKIERLKRFRCSKRVAGDSSEASPGSDGCSTWPPAPG